ncbi:LOW QUALITY PROTEIN: transmembrane protein 198-like [Carassius gibelio]|uniref:LOW QUALITY PROTEIN: transmembrane protein 198-like n=1 Tax=Carassius gibelio TaxID=101364 RepID=UPI0022781033|nr:LOW QUALITY PROTEIN: transmembrane protein 198-like [Carassius gibelio]
MMNESLSATETTRAVCDLEIRRESDLLPAVSCSLGFALGLIYCFCGYRCFKTVLFLSGLALGSAVGQMLCVQERVLDGRTRAGVSLGVGLLAALVAVLVPSVGLFFTGLQLGALLSGAALLLLGQYYPVFSAAWIPVGVLIGTSAFFAVITLCWRKAMMIAATAVGGAAVVTACVGYWVEIPVWVLRPSAGVQTLQGLCWYSWAVIGIWPVLAALGTLVQSRITAHADVCVRREQKQLDLTRIRHTCDRRHTQGTYRRRPPVLQRYTGDVLAPSYLASLQERQTHTGSSLWSLTSVHHTMIDFDSETGSLVPLTASASALLRL